jgi:hypothetical protein
MMEIGIFKEKKKNYLNLPSKCEALSLNQYCQKKNYLKNALSNNGYFNFFLSFFLSFFVVLGIEFSDSCLLGKCSTT